MTEIFKTYNYWVGKGQPRHTVIVSLHDLEMPVQDVFTKFDIKSSKKYPTHVVDIVRELCAKHGVDFSKYSLACCIDLLQRGETSYHLCECGSGIEVLPRSLAKPVHERTRFCDVQCPASIAARAAHGRKTCLEKYGHENPWSIPGIIKQMTVERVANYANAEWPERLLRIELDTGIRTADAWTGFKSVYNWKCKEGHEFQQQLFNGFHPVCRTCNPVSSKVQQEIQHFIQELGLEVQVNDRTIIKPYELDLVIESKKVAIEVNGVYYHDVHAVEPGYHLRKTEMSEAAGYHLIQITDAEWIGKRELVKSRLRSILHMQQAHIGARQCKIVDVSSAAAKQFCNDNHLQGHAACSIRVGLEHKGALVAVMTFGKPRFDKHHDYELIRLCYSRNTSVVGGAAKMLAHFTKQYGTSVMSYCDRRYSKGAVYAKLGFKLLHASAPNYVYLNLKGVTYTRYQCMKHKLPKLLETYDASKTETENMKANGFWKIEDSGNLVYSLK